LRPYRKSQVTFANRTHQSPAQGSIQGHRKTFIQGDCFYRVATEEGVKAFWRGNMANVIRYFPTTAINFSVKDFFQRKFVKGINPEK
jgi:hypothetical protein